MRCWWCSHCSPTCSSSPVPGYVAVPYNIYPQIVGLRSSTTIHVAVKTNLPIVAGVISSVIQNLDKEALCNSYRIKGNHVPFISENRVWGNACRKTVGPFGITGPFSIKSDSSLLGINRMSVAGCGCHDSSCVHKQTKTAQCEYKENNKYCFHHSFFSFSFGRYDAIS